MKDIIKLYWRNFLFRLSYQLNYPLVAPDMLQLCFTFRCNLKCRMCNMSEKMEEFKQRGVPYELPFFLMKDLISQAYNMKVKEVYFVGGEPLIEGKIFELVKYTSDFGMSSVINTNGLLLNEEKINNIFESGLSCITFSIDGPDRKIHDVIRGENVFDRTTYNLEKLLLTRRRRRKTKPRVNILCTVMKENITKLAEMVIFAKNIGVDGLCFQPLVSDNTDQSKVVNSESWITSEMYNILDESVNRIKELKKNDFSDFIINSLEQIELMKPYFRGNMVLPKRCYLGLSRVIVSQDYKVYFCAPDPVTGKISFGDVSKVPLANLWKSKEAKRFRKNIKYCKQPCLLFCSDRTEFGKLFGSIYQLIKNKILH